MPTLDSELQDIVVTARPIPTDQHIDNRDFRIEAVELISSDGRARDIRALVGEVQVRQDLFLGFMSGEMIMQDGVDMFADAAMHGGEYIYLHIKMPGLNRSLKKAFRIYKVDHRVPAMNNAQRYIVYFSSDEIITSYTKKVSKAYMSSKISDAAVDIMTKYMNIPSNKIFVDPTSEAVDVVIPNYRPAEALHWLASRAFNGSSLCYLFYETLDGFNFRSLQSLYAQKALSDQPYIFDSKSLDKQLSYDIFGIDDFESKRDFDLLTTLGNGGVAFKMIGVDPFYQSITVNEYSIGSMPKLYSNPAMSNPSGLFNKSDSYLLTYLQTNPTMTDKKNFSEVWISRVLSLAALNNNLIDLVVPGNLNIQAGRIVEVNFPYTITPSSGTNMSNTFKSGRYLVAAVNHKFDFTHHKFSTIFMITRDSLPEPLPMTDTRLPEKIAKINSESNKS